MTARDRWDDYAICRGEDDLMCSDNPLDQAEAKDVCAGCPVAEQCLTAALAEEGSVLPRERAGVRGGLTPEERYSHYRRSLRAAAEATPTQGRALPADTVKQLDEMLHAGKPTREITAALGISDATTTARRRKLGIPAPGRALKPCGTYAAYKRHRDRGETACTPCLAANALYTATGGTVTALPDVELTA